MRLAQTTLTFGFHYKFSNENDIILPSYTACKGNDCDAFYALEIIYIDKKKNYYHNLEVYSARRYKLWSNNSWGAAQYQAEAQTLSQYLCINLLRSNTRH